MDIDPQISPTVGPPSSNPSSSGSAIYARNPLPLSASQESEVRDLYYKRVRSKCAEEIREFAQCCKGRTFSIAWACKNTQRAMNTCMLSYANRQEEDAAREEWFAGYEERRRKKEENAVAVEKRRVEVIELIQRQKEKEAAEAETKKREMEKASGWWR